ncbi:MAG: hypothetical protein OXP75_15640 [Rhodospirillales bacterium]|nr:hypothetical protein [Rhodospirillales bacterium]
MAASPPDHLCGRGHSPADPRQSDAERKVCWHAERLLNMVHAYCEIRDSWTGWLRGDALSRTLYERIVPEMRALQGAERRVIGTPSVTLLAALDYAACARQAVPAYTPRKTIDHPQPPVSDGVREVCERMSADAERDALAARQASAREYAARMTQAIERERAEEQRRLRAMVEHSVTETPAEAARAKADLEARIAFYQRELDRVSDDAGLAPSSREATGHEKTEATRAQAIRAAMRAWAGPRLKWGRHRGAPHLRALRRATGLGDITRAERNRLWRAPKVEAGGPAERRAET